MAEPTLSMSLDRLVRLLRTHIASVRPMGLDELAGLHAEAIAWRERAAQLEARAAVADELEAVARDLDLIAHAKTGEPRPCASSPEPVARPGGDVVDLSEALAREHREMQRAVEAGFERIERLAAREAELAAGNVVPLRPRTALVSCGGPNDGDAA